MSPIEQAVAWTLSIITSVYTPGSKIYYPAAEETVQEAETRVEDVAGDVVEIVFNPDTTPLFTGKYGRARTTTLMLAIMTNESGFRKDVDFALGKDGRGDGGNSWCLMQLNIGTKPTFKWNWVEDRTPRWGDDPLNIFDGYYGPELVADRRLCISEGLKAMKMSMGACKKLPLEQRLAAYVSGKCIPEGFPGSEDRFRTAMRWFGAKKKLMTFDEQAVLDAWPEWQKQRHSYVISGKHLDQVTISKRVPKTKPVAKTVVKPSSKTTKTVSVVVSNGS